MKSFLFLERPFWGETFSRKERRPFIQIGQLRRRKRETSEKMKKKKKKKKNKREQVSSSPALRIDYTHSSELHSNLSLSPESSLFSLRSFSLPPFTSAIFLLGKKERKRENKKEHLSVCRFFERRKEFSVQELKEK